MKRWMIVAAVSAALAASGVVIATNVANAAEHEVFDGALPMEVCGFAGTDHLHAIDNFGIQNDGQRWDSGSIVETFTADNGRSVVTRFAGHLQNLPPVQNPDGTTTYETRYTGAQMQTKAVDGPVLQTNSGQLDVLLTLDPDGNPIDFSVVVKAGPNPNPTGRIDCSVVAPYLAGN